MKGFFNFWKKADDNNNKEEALFSNIEENPDANMDVADDMFLNGNYILAARFQNGQYTTPPICGKGC